MEKTKIMDMVQTFIEKKGWECARDHEREIIRMGINLQNRLNRMSQFVLCDGAGYTVVGLLPVHAETEDEQQMDEIMRYICLINYDLVEGHFDLDFRDGEIRYRLHRTLLEQNDISDGSMESSLMLPGILMERYGDGFLSLIIGNSTAEEEVEKTKNKQQ